MCFLLFQSTHSRRVRRRTDNNRRPVTLVSIHALTKSATHYYPTVKPTLWFQSTHSRRVRLSVQSYTQVIFMVSIHALTKSATVGSCTPCSLLIVSIHALTKSATCTSSSIIRSKDCFNPRTHEECDLPHRHSLIFLTVSIHALTKSATMYLLST